MKSFLTVILTSIVVTSPLHAIAQASQCFDSISAWQNSPSGREFAAISRPMLQKLPEAKANPYGVDSRTWQDFVRTTNSLLTKSQNTKFCSANDQREFNGVRSSLVEWRDHASGIVRAWKDFETDYQRGAQGLDCPAYKEAQYKCATAGNPSHCIKVLFPAVSERHRYCL
jgi:hypothetical protein